MRDRRLTAVVTSVICGSLVLAPAASAQRVREGYVSSYIPARIDGVIGFTPSHGIHPPNQALRPVSVRYAGRTWRFVYRNSAAVWPSTGLIVRTLSRASGFGAATSGAFVDRRLTARERRRLSVRADLGREADVLVVAREHPACTNGLTVAQARGIARGTVTRWSGVGSLAPGAPDTIAVRVKTDGTGAKEPRWGVTDAKRFAAGSRGASDGGLGQAAQGDLAVAGLTSWSKARGYGDSVCAVPVDGVAPTDASVFALQYAAAYPITFVVSRRLSGAPRERRAAMKGFVDWLKGPAAAEQFRARGMLLVADGIPPAA